MTAVERWTSTRYPDVGLYIRPGTSDEKAAKEVLDKNAYQRPRLGFTLESGDRWLDAGANVGAFSVLACHLGADAVVAVEPLPAHLELLYSNIAGLPVVVVEGVVATEPGGYRLGIRPAETEWRSSILPDHRDVDAMAVQGFTVNQLIGAFSLTCVKLDVEGAEIAILEDWPPPEWVRKIAWEWSFDVDPSTGRLRDVIRRLRAFGFQVNYPSQVDRFDTWEWYPWGRLCFAWR